MADFFGSIWWFIVALGLLVSFHEFGHFWVARRMGVKVLRFSVGFGRPLWSRRDAEGTEYAVAAIPLGGYVKMLDEREGEVPAAEVDRAFNRKSLGARTAIVAAGPVFNLVFALAAFWLMYVIGIPEIRPVFAEPTGLAAEAGLEAGDRVTRVADEPVETLTQFSLELLPYAIDREPVRLTVVEDGGGDREITLPLDRLGADFREEALLRSVGLAPWQPNIEPVVGTLSPGFPAQEAGIELGDRILAIGDRAIEDWAEIGTAIQAQAVPGRPFSITVARDGRTVELSIVPQRETAEGPWLIGIAPPQLTESEYQAYRQKVVTDLEYGPVAAVGQAVSETWRMTARTLGLLRRMVTGDASLRNLSGPISIAQYANDHAQLGLPRFLFFLAVLSLSLAILNFLPIPLLDGGHLLYYFIEWIKGRPLSERSQIIGQYVGLAALAGLVSLTLYNDILRLMS